MLWGIVAISPWIFPFNWNMIVSLLVHPTFQVSPQEKIARCEVQTPRSPWSITFVSNQFFKKHIVDCRQRHICSILLHRNSCCCIPQIYVTVNNSRNIFTCSIDFTVALFPWLFSKKCRSIVPFAKMAGLPIVLGE